MSKQTGKERPVAMENNGDRTRGEGVRERGREKVKWWRGQWKEGGGGGRKKKKVKDSHSKEMGFSPLCLTTPSTANIMNTRTVSNKFQAGLCNKQMETYFKAQCKCTTDH